MVISIGEGIDYKLASKNLNVDAIVCIQTTKELIKKEIK